MNNPLSVCPVLDVKWAVLVLNISHLLSALFLITFEGPPPSRSHHAINNLELLDKIKLKKLICKYVFGLLFSQVYLILFVLELKLHLRTRRTYLIILLLLLLLLLLLTSARLLLAAPLPPLPYRPLEILRPRTKYVLISPLPFTWKQRKSQEQSDSF